MGEAGPRVIITGFGGFPGVTDNPSEAVVEALQGTPDLLPTGTECRLLETAYARVGPALEAMLPSPGCAQPLVALVMTGYSALAEGFRLERRAGGLCSPRFADADGYCPPQASELGPLDLRENKGCDFAALQAGLSAESFACHLSDQAGQYVCNYAYHIALTRIAVLGLPTRVVFIHVPAISDTPLATTSASAMPLADMARGIALIAGVLADR